MLLQRRLRDFFGRPGCLILAGGRHSGAISGHRGTRDLSQELGPWLRRLRSFSTVGSSRCSWRPWLHGRRSNEDAWQCLTYKRTSVTLGPRYLPRLKQILEDSSVHSKSLFDKGWTAGNMILAPRLSAGPGSCCLVHFPSRCIIQCRRVQHRPIWQAQKRSRTAVRN